MTREMSGTKETVSTFAVTDAAAFTHLKAQVLTALPLFFARSSTSVGLCILWHNTVGFDTDT